jgi:hypothetical protein
MPWVAALLSKTVTTGRKDVVVGFVAGTFAYSVAALMPYAAGVARDRRAPALWALLPAAFALALASSGLALVVSAETIGSDGEERVVLADGLVWIMSDQDSASFKVGLMQLFSLMAVSALVSRFVKSPVLAAGAGGFVVLVITLVPAVIDEFTIGQPAFGFVNFAYATATEDVVAGAAFWGVLSLVAIACARAKRRA